LTRGEWCGHQLHAVDDSIEAALEQLYQIVAGVAAPTVRFFIKSPKLALADIRIIALELLLGGELRSESEGFLRRWPCWPGPYSRRFSGLFGRPHRLTARRRLILYFAAIYAVLRFQRRAAFRPKTFALISGVSFG